MLGHLFVYNARRPVPANNFGPYLDAEKFDRAREFYLVSSEAEAVAIAERLGVRYVVTQAQGVVARSPGELFEQLHARDGAAAAGRPALERFRLVTELPFEDSRRAFTWPPRRRSKPPMLFKLFELVEGAVLEVRGEPGELLVAEVPIGTPSGRRFLHRAVSAADSSGTARVRVPYSTDASPHAGATGPYAVRFGGASWQVRVPDAAVREGRVIGVPPVPEAQPAADPSAGPGE
jgi:hypothetical protein